MGNSYLPFLAYISNFLPAGIPTYQPSFNSIFWYSHLPSFVVFGACSCPSNTFHPKLLTFISKYTHMSDRQQKVLISAGAALLIPPKDKQPHFALLLYSFPAARYKHIKTHNLFLLPLFRHFCHKGKFQSLQKHYVLVVIWKQPIEDNVLRRTL